MKRYILLILTIALCGRATALQAQTPIARWTFNETSGATTASEAVNGAVFNVVNTLNNPERITGVEGNALRLDGYSTWAQANGFGLSGVSTAITLEVWYAPEAYNNANVGLMSQMTASAGYSLNVTRFGEPVFVFFADGQQITVQSSQKLNRYEWNHLVATADTEAQTAKRRGSRLAETIYWIGTFEADFFTPYDREPKAFVGLEENFLSPAMGVDEDGRISYIGIIPEDRPADDQVASGWRQTFSIPRAYRLLNSRPILFRASPLSFSSTPTAKKLPSSTSTCRKTPFRSTAPTLRSRRIRLSSRQYKPWTTCSTTKTRSAYIASSTARLWKCSSISSPCCRPASTRPERKAIKST